MKTALNSKNLGQFILEHRRKLNLTQGALAKRLGMSAQFLGHIEKGEVDIPNDKLTKLIEEFSLSKDAVFKIYLKVFRSRLKDILNL